MTCLYEVVLSEITIMAAENILITGWITDAKAVLRNFNIEITFFILFIYTLGVCV